LDGTNHSVTCVGLTRSNETHAAARVIGHQPLRQFLVPAPGGRWQVLEAAYDPVTNEWFNVYGTEDRQPGEWGHWTGRGMNWNSMCAGCHNTRFRKNYDAATDSYRTVMAEPAVGCEACHGPLQAHLDWQARFGASGRPDPTVPRLDRALVLDYCGFCHARRTDLTGDFKPGDRFGEHHDLVIPDTTDTYYPDGQVRDEDFEYAAFLGSRMHTNDVHCLDCHEPHSAKTRLPGNWLCLRCHNGGHPNAPVIQPVEHAHHKVRGFGADGQAIDFDLTSYNPRSITETGGECVNCHLPQTVYMQRHRRHDHGLTSPDPLLTRQFGIPNACNRCHLDKTVDWSVEWCDKWYGTRMDRPARARTQWIARARAGDTAARGPLVSLLEGNDSPYWKAVAARLLVRWARDPAVTAALLRSTAHPDPLVRVSAARALTPLMDLPDAPAGLRLRRLLEDQVRAVRIAAAAALGPQITTNSAAARDDRYFLELNADQPGGQMQLGAVAFAAGQWESARAHYAQAVKWDPNSAPIRHELAVVLSRLGRPREAVTELQTACRLEPKQAEFPFKLGLAWNEAGDLDRAAAALAQAVALDPGHARAWYNLGLARNSLGHPDEALEALVRAESVAPDDPSIPYARGTILARLGRRAEARDAVRRALEVQRDFTAAQQLLEHLK
jgi:tetratricopeptide (TPR) repeat protein